MRNTKREVECIKRLQILSPVYEELIQFLMQDTLLSKEELKVIKNSPDQGKILHTKLVSLSEERKLQLLEFEWNLLPVERIRVLLVTEHGFREFLAEV